MDWLVFNGQLTGLLASLTATTSLPIRSVRLEGVTQGANPQAVYDLTLGQVRVNNYEDTSSGDTLSFTYQLVNLTTTAINSNGSRGGSQTFSWDLTTNTPGGSITTPVPGVGAGMEAPGLPSARSQEKVCELPGEPPELLVVVVSATCW